MTLAPINHLISWARDHGAHIHDLVEAYDDPKYGIALRVRPARGSGDLGGDIYDSSPEEHSLPPKSRIVSCPFTLSLSYINALNIFHDLQGHSPQFPAIFIGSLEPHVIGHFFLIQQYLNVETSHWGPYIRSLPQPGEAGKLGTPLYFTQSDMAWIRGTDLELAQEQRERSWKSDWDGARQILDTSNGWEEWMGKWTWDLYKWAATIFSSRSFISTLIPDEVFTPPVLDEAFRNLDERHSSGSYLDLQTAPPTLDSDNPAQQEGSSHYDTFPVLFPIIDLANHSSTARVTWFTNVHNDPKDLSIIVDSEIPYGHQIFNNYAPKSNTELMLGYGFCIPGNDEVAVTIKPLGSETLDIAKRHWSCLHSNNPDATQSTFHVRANPYARPSHDNRLFEFKMFEDGCVDILAVLTANQREHDFMIKQPHQCPERSSEAVFTGPLSRNILKTMSVLFEQLKGVLDKITFTGECLGVPETSCQHVAKVYRDGQISVLEAVTRPLQLRLDVALSQHTLCDHSGGLLVDYPRFVDMRLNVELITLSCAFSWLKFTYPAIYKHSINIIAKELEVIMNPTLDWIELISGGWDYTLWCLWIYIVLFLYLLEKESHTRQTHITRWVDYMSDIYNPGATFSGSAFGQFHGDRDEGETLRVMINQINPTLFVDRSILNSMANIGDDKDKLLNFASKIAKEETFTVNVKMDGRTGKERVHQGVLFLKKFPDLDENSVE